MDEHPLSARMKSALRIAVEVVALAGIWFAATALSQGFIPALPGSVLGMGALLLALASGWIKPDWLMAGSRWLLGELLLFFIPAVIAIVNYGDFVRLHGLAILAVIVLSTVAAMIATALAVEAITRWLARRRRPPT